MTLTYNHPIYGPLEVMLSGHTPYEAPSMDGIGSQEEFFFDVFDEEDERVDYEEFYDDLVEIARGME